MSRWTIREIYYFSHDGQRRTVALAPTGMTIITGPSGTGKSAIIETVDYCLCSSECNIPRYVRDRCACVGVLWTNGTNNLLVCRLIPRTAGTSSQRMYVLVGGEIDVPTDYRKLRGPTNLETARKEIHSLFGIGDVYQQQDSELEPLERISIRHATPYIFLSKNVIDSNSVVLHGMEEPRFYPDIVNSLPYFLGIVDEKTLKYERELRGLLVEAAKEERRVTEVERARTSERDAITALLAEAIQAGIIDEFTAEASTEELLGVLGSASRWRRGRSSGVSTDIRQQIQSEQEQLFKRLRELRDRRTVARSLNELADDFESTVSVEKQRLEVFQLFDPNARVDDCPVCSHPMDEPNTMANAINSALLRLNQEEVALQRHKPKFDSALHELDEQITGTRKRLAELEARVAALVAEDDRAREALDANTRANQVVGRITYYLDNRDPRGSGATQERLERIRERIAMLREELNTEAREQLTRRIENRLSASASVIMRALPLEEPCINADLVFNAKHVEVTVTNEASSIPTRLKSVGSDQNYLAIHISLYLALHRFFSKHSRPVPGVVFVDQVSRPYFPPQKHPDVVAVRGDASDPETAAVRQHFDLLFKEVEEWPDLQIIVLEHAVFEDDRRYMAAIKHQWSKDSSNKLIPSDWPVQSE